jgi:hypothetical protein
MKKITHNWLEVRGACQHQRKLFKELYPQGIPVCWKCFREAQSKGLEVYWLSHFTDLRLTLYFYIKDRDFPKLADKYHLTEWLIWVLDAKALRMLEKALLEI